ncbi:MAG: AraC family transcriptional regulator [Silanimonas sp.]
MFEPKPLHPTASGAPDPFDRLAPILDTFRVRASLFHAGALCGVTRFDAQPGRAFLHVLRSGELSVRHGDAADDARVVHAPVLLFYPRAFGHTFINPPVDGADFLCATLAFDGGDEHPLAAALPAVVILPLAEVDGLEPTLAVLFAEADRARCGSRVVLDRLFDVVLVQLMRHLITDDGRARLNPGLLAGLAHPRLAPLLNALHRAPGEDWPLSRMCRTAGLSRSAFAETFSRVIGRSPAAYLADWRMQMACRQLLAGRPVSAVADGLGYASPAAFARAFRDHKGCAPREWRAQQG